MGLFNILLQFSKTNVLFLKCRHQCVYAKLFLLFIASILLTTTDAQPVGNTLSLMCVVSHIPHHNLVLRLYR